MHKTAKLTIIKTSQDIKTLVTFYAVGPNLTSDIVDRFKESQKSIFEQQNFFSETSS